MDVVALVYLLILHAPGGHEIDLNPKRITSMHEVEYAAKSGYVADEIRCAINTDDGKSVNVTETCEEVRRQITTSGPREEQ